LIQLAVLARREPVGYPGGFLEDLFLIAHAPFWPLDMELVLLCVDEGHWTNVSLFQGFQVFCLLKRAYYPWALLDFIS